MSNLDIAQRIAEAKRSAEQGKAELLKTFSFVPDDKLGWSPSETARSAVWIVAHCGMANRACATALRGEPMQMPQDPQEAAAMIWNAGRDVTSREEAVRMVEESTTDVIAALDGVTAERLAGHTETSFGPIPNSIWVAFAGNHMSGHARQIDYLQTTWGDLETRM